MFSVKIVDSYFWFISCSLFTREFTRGLYIRSTCVSQQAKYNIFSTIFILYGFHSNEVGCFNRSEYISILHSMIIRTLNTTWLYRCVAIRSLAIRYANRQTSYRDAPVHRWIVAPLIVTNVWVYTVCTDP